MTWLSITLAAATLAAQPQIKPNSPADARQALRQFADCAAKRDPKVAHRFVMLNEGELLPQPLYHDLFSGRCLRPYGFQLKMRPWRSRSALAESLVRLQPAAFQPTSFARVAALDWNRANATKPAPGADPAAAAQNEATSQAEVLMSQLGECVARADAPGVFAVLGTSLDSPDEKMSLEALAPKIAGCLPHGQTLSLSRPNLRNAVALAYYRLSAHSKAAS